MTKHETDSLDALAELNRRLEAGGIGNSFEEIATALRLLTGNRRHTAAEELLRVGRNEH